MSYVGRFAPSPTGQLHLGIARTHLAAWLDARASGGRILMRIEDVDVGRAVPGAAEQIMADMRWLGMDWDGEVTWQSARSDRYEVALDHLAQLDRTFPCTCSRKEIAIASAPHDGEEGPRYPGTCRSGPQRSDRTPSIRLRTRPEDLIRFEDRRAGPVEQDVEAAVGDFVLRRADGLFAYQLAVTVDDLEQGVTSVVRGDDLLSSTPRQLLLRRLLDPDAAPLSTLHVPLLRNQQGQRLSKRDGAMKVTERSESAPELVGMLAASLGLVPPGTQAMPEDLVTHWRVDALDDADQAWAFA